MQRTRLDQVRNLISINNGTITLLESYTVAGNGIVTSTQTEIDAATTQDDKDAWTAYLKHMDTGMDNLRSINVNFGLKMVELKSEKCIIKMFLNAECGGKDASEPPMAIIFTEL